jgi:hypothetical protein
MVSKPLTWTVSRAEFEDFRARRHCEVGEGGEGHWDETELTVLALLED